MKGKMAGLIVFSGSFLLICFVWCRRAIRNRLAVAVVNRKKSKKEIHEKIME